MSPFKALYSKAVKKFVIELLLLATFITSLSLAAQPKPLLITKNSPDQFYYETSAAEPDYKKSEAVGRIEKALVVTEILNASTSNADHRALIISSNQTNEADVVVAEKLHHLFNTETLTDEQADEIISILKNYFGLTYQQIFNNMKTLKIQYVRAGIAVAIFRTAPDTLSLHQWHNFTTHEWQTMYGISSYKKYVEDFAAALSEFDLSSENTNKLMSLRYNLAMRLFSLPTEATFKGSLLRSEILSKWPQFEWSKINHKIKEFLNQRAQAKTIEEKNEIDEKIRACHQYLYQILNIILKEFNQSQFFLKLNQLLALNISHQPYYGFDVENEFFENLGRIATAFAVNNNSYLHERNFAHNLNESVSNYAIPAHYVRAMWHEHQRLQPEHLNEPNHQTITKVYKDVLEQYFANLSDSTHTKTRNAKDDQIFLEDYIELLGENAQKTLLQILKNNILDQTEEHPATEYQQNVLMLMSDKLLALNERNDFTRTHNYYFVLNFLIHNFHSPNSRASIHEKLFKFFLQQTQILYKPAFYNHTVHVWAQLTNTQTPAHLNSNQVDYLKLIYEWLITISPARDQEKFKIQYIEYLKTVIDITRNSMQQSVGLGSTFALEELRTQMTLAEFKSYVDKVAQHEDARSTKRQQDTQRFGNSESYTDPIIEMAFDRIVHYRNALIDSHTNMPQTSTCRELIDEASGVK